MQSTLGTARLLCQASPWPRSTCGVSRALPRVSSFAVSHRPGAFKAELSKLVIVAKASRSEL